MFGCAIYLTITGAAVISSTHRLHLIASSLWISLKHNPSLALRFNHYPLYERFLWLLITFDATKSSSLNSILYIFYCTMYCTNPAFGCQILINFLSCLVNYANI